MKPANENRTTLRSHFFWWGTLSLPGTLFLACRLIWEMTLFTHEHGEQMVGFSFLHVTNPFLLLLVLASVVSSALFSVTGVLDTIIRVVRRHRVSSIEVGLVLVCIIVLSSFAVPYALWQRLTLECLGPGRHAASLMTRAMLAGNTSLVDAYLAHGIDVNARDQYDETALMNAAKTGSIVDADHLLSRGAGIHLQTAAGQNALTIAGDRKHYSLAKYLFSRGARFAFLPDTIASLESFSDEKLRQLFVREDSLMQASPGYTAAQDSIWRRSTHDY